MSRTGLAAVALLVSIASHARAQEAPRRIVVGTHEIAPFVVRQDDGSWGGISIDLWRRIASELRYETEIRELPTAELVSGHADVDVVISLVINADREALFDLTHAFYSTGLAIAVAPHTPSIVGVLVERVLTWDFLWVLAVLAVSMLLAAIVMWRLEHRENPDEFGGGRGLVAGVMWAIETVVGYNDPQHKTRTGRAFGILWAAIGVIAISALTARLASQLTVDELASDVRGLDDLGHVTVGTVEGSPAAAFLSRRGIRARGYDDASAAVDALARGEVRAVVYEAPILEYEIAQRGGSDLSVLPGTFDDHGYGFGLRAGSPIREDVDRAMLRVLAGDEWHATLARYLGAQ